jgi:hypothetical protein
MPLTSSRPSQARLIHTDIRLHLLTAHTIFAVLLGEDHYELAREYVLANWI